MPALVRIESLGPFFNTLVADDKYSRRNMQNFQQQLQTALSKKKKDIFCNFLCFYQIYIKFIIFSKIKDESPSFSISQIIDSQRGGYLNVQKALLQNTFRQSTCSRVPNTVEISTTSLLSYISMNMRKIKLEKLRIGQIWNLRTFC